MRIPRSSAIVSVLAALAMSVCSTSGLAQPPMAYQPSWSPDGKSVAYPELLRPPGGMGEWHPDTGGSRVIMIPISAAMPVVWLSTHEWAVAGREKKDGSSSGPLALYLVNRSNSAFRRVEGTSDEGFGAMSASPDGSRVALSGRKPGGRESGLWLVDVATAKAAPFAQLDGVSDEAPRFSPDGKRVLFTRVTPVAGGGEEMPPMNLCVADIESAQVATLTTDNVSHTGSFSPDGKRIAFHRTTEDEELWLMDADGGNARVLKAGPFVRPEWTLAPIWRPDGRYVMFLSEPQLFAVPIEGAGLDRVSGEVEISRRGGFDLSPDGKRLVYGGQRDHFPALCVMDVQWPEG